MLLTGSPGWRPSFANWKGYCLPGRITYQADTLVMPVPCQSRWANDFIRTIDLGIMIYKIVHRTTYRYKHPVSVGTHVACLKPRALPHHQLAQSDLHIQPRPATRTERVDFFGNRLCFFTIQEPHRELVVEAHSEVIMNGNATPWPRLPLPWEEAAESVRNDRSPAGLQA